MLVVTRKLDEVVHIGEGITVKVVEIRRESVRLGITAPKDVAITQEKPSLPSGQDED